jgi:hypothetical protein
MDDILSLLNKKQKKISYIVVALILCLSAFELLIFSLIQPIIIFFARDDGVDKIKAFGSNFNFNVSALDVLIFFFIVFVIRSFLSLFVKNQF